jgi:hypothetical protein
MCLRRAPEKYIAGAALDRAAVYCRYRLLGEPSLVSSGYWGSFSRDTAFWM